jgi:hypothetical protein
MGVGCVSGVESSSGVGLGYYMRHEVNETRIIATFNELSRHRGYITLTITVDDVCEECSTVTAQPR